ncbi:MAG: hypothetical protein LLG06_09335 [Desulfobacteraceae bacterium]|nr:hypothetical protein [Desulfobacteraceae bacterium]
MEYNITELRKQGRPLWMTDFELESTADLLGGGGDIYTDRLPIDTYREIGMEMADEESPEELSVQSSAGQDRDFVG